MLILDSFHAVVPFGLGKDLLFKSTLGHCGNTLLCKILAFSHIRFKILCGSLAQGFSSHFTQGVSIGYTKGEWYVSFRGYIAQWDF